MEVRDPIHGFIEYDDLEEKIINTNVFQRLRNIKQLALANYVYPGALHTRFDHSLGVMHLAGKIAKIFYPNKKDKSKVKIIRLAGLLHDIGHGPFSHVSEQLLENNTENLSYLLNKYKAENAHELISIFIIKDNKEINTILDKETINNIIGLLQKSQEGYLEKDIVSGPLDADKFDYVLRDSYFSGVAYGIFDIDKIIECLTEIPTAREIKRIGVKEEGIYALEQFLLANYHMKMQVYYHRIRRIADAMLIKGIKYAIDEKVKGIRELFNIKDNSTFTDEYLKYSDYVLIDKLIKEGNTTKYYFNNLKSRSLFKEICALEIKEEDVDMDSIIFDKIKSLKENHFYRMSKSISEFLKTKFKSNIKPEYIIVDRQTFTNPTFKPPGKRIDANTIFILTKDNKRKQFPKLSDVFKIPTIETERNWLYVYAPIDELDKNKRETLKKGLTSHIKDILINN